MYRKQKKKVRESIKTGLGSEDVYKLQRLGKSIALILCSLPKIKMLLAESIINDVMF